MQRLVAMLRIRAHKNYVNLRESCKNRRGSCGDPWESCGLTVGGKVAAEGSLQEIGVANYKTPNDPGHA
jgi:hypothetical protein